MSKFEDILEPDTWYTSAELREFDGVVRHDVYNAKADDELVSKPNPKGGRAKLYALPPSTNTRLVDETEEETADVVHAEPAADETFELSDDPEELKAELAGAEAEIEELQDHVDRVAAERDAAKEELEELRKQTPAEGNETLVEVAEDMLEAIDGADELRAELTSVRSERDVAQRSCNRLRQKIDRMREADTVAAQDAQELRERLEKMLHEHPLSSLVIESQYARADLAQWVGVFLDVAHQRIHELEERVEVTENAAAELDAGEFVPVEEYEDLRIAYRAVNERGRKLEEALDRSNGVEVLRQAPELSPGGDVDVLVEACWKVLTGRAGDTTTIAAALQRFYQGDQEAERLTIGDDEGPFGEPYPSRSLIPSGGRLNKET